MVERVPIGHGPVGSEVTTCGGNLFLDGPNCITSRHALHIFGLFDRQSMNTCARFARAAAILLCSGS